MKFRSFLLLACMVVVPTLAMFSHLIPPQVRLAARRHAAGISSQWFGTSAAAAAPAQQSAAPSGSVPGQNAFPESDGSVVKIPPPQAVNPKKPTPQDRAKGVPESGRSATGSVGVPEQTAFATPEVPAAPPLVAQMADRTRQARDQQAREVQAVATQLAAWGAVGFDCQPLPGTEGMFSSGCRVPVDATGQLQRVFQATSTDPASAAAALLKEVASWRRRAVPATAASSPEGVQARSAEQPASSLTPSDGRPLESRWNGTGTTAAPTSFSPYATTPLPPDTPRP